MNKLDDSIINDTKKTLKYIVSEEHMNLSIFFCSLLHSLRNKVLIWKKCQLRGTFDF